MSFAAACRIFPFDFGGQAVTLNVTRLGSHAAQEEFRTPCAEGLCLLPRHAHHRVVVVGRRREVVLHVHGVARVREVVHPHRRVGIDGNDVGVDEIVERRERTVDGFAHNFAVVVHVGRVFRDHHHLIGVDFHVGVEHTFARIETIFAECRLFVVESLVAEVHLLHVEHARAVIGVRFIHTVEGALLIFRGFAPRQGLVPVEMRLDGVAKLVDLNFIGLIAAVRRVGQSFAQDTIAHPLHKLSVHRVGHFGLIHPETIHRDVTLRKRQPPKTVVLGQSHFEIAAFDFNHAVGRGFEGHRRALSRHFATVAHGHVAPAEA